MGELLFFFFHVKNTLVLLVVLGNYITFFWQDKYNVLYRLIHLIGGDDLLVCSNVRISGTEFIFFYEKFITIYLRFDDDF